MSPPIGPDRLSRDRQNLGRRIDIVFATSGHRGVPVFGGEPRSISTSSSVSCEEPCSPCRGPSLLNDVLNYSAYRLGCEHQVRAGFWFYGPPRLPYAISCAVMDHRTEDPFPHPLQTVAESGPTDTPLVPGHPRSHRAAVSIVPMSHGDLPRKLPSGLFCSSSPRTIRVFVTWHRTLRRWRPATI